jgi:hypothetical protein
VLYLWLIILSLGGDVHIDNETFLVTDFVNLKIKTTQSFRNTHKNMMEHVYIYRYDYSLKNKFSATRRRHTTSHTAAGGYLGYFFVGSVSVTVTSVMYMVLVLVSCGQIL